ncbi:hypothetical protein UT300012_23180 [Paraclostridium bifermentans]
MFDWFIYASPGEKVGIVLLIIFGFGLFANKGGGGSRGGGSNGGGSNNPS